MASFVPVFGLHPQLSPEEKNVEAGTYLDISSHSYAALLFGLLGTKSRNFPKVPSSEAQK